MSETNAEMMDSSDVYIEKLDPEPCEGCEAIDAFLADEETPATKIVRVDFRELGKSFEVGKYCDSCAEAVAERLRCSLPKENQ